MDTLTAAAEALTRPEADHLVRLERTVERTIAAVGRIAGASLATIRDQRLYRATHTTFGAYVEARFGVTRATAYRWIVAATPPAATSPIDQAAAPEDVSPRDKPSTSHGESQVLIDEDLQDLDAGDDDPARDRAQPAPSTTHRRWATVLGAGGGELHLQVDVATVHYPPVDGRVLLAWTT